jgi:hypothetical protein
LGLDFHVDHGRIRDVFGVLSSDPTAQNPTLPNTIIHSENPFLPPSRATVLWPKCDASLVQVRRKCAASASDVHQRWCIGFAK